MNELSHAPQTTGNANWGIAGHHRAVSLLRHAIAGERVSHAYLFEGIRQIGKTTLALAFAQALNCQSPNAPCGECRSCRNIAKGIHPDVRLLHLQSAASEEASGKRKTGSRTERRRVKNIAMDEVRALLRDVVLAPYEGRWKVYVIRYAEDLSLDGMQTLLKTLEEPPPHVVLTLTSVDGNILPLTVVSRCQSVKMATVPSAEIETALVGRYGAEPGQAKLLSRLCGGRIGWAIDALADPDLVEARDRRLVALLDTVSARRVERLAYAEQLATEWSRDPESVATTLELWLSWYRDVLLTKNGAQAWVINDDRRRELAEHATRFHDGQLAGLLEAIRTALRQLQQSANARLALEVLMLSVPSGAR